MSHFTKRLLELMAAEPDKPPRARSANLAIVGGVRTIRERQDDDEAFYPVLWAHQTTWDSRKRAKLKGLDWSLHVGWIITQLEAQEYCCAISGIEFSGKRLGTAHKRPYMPSLDRIDCNKGYTPENVRIVCVAVNTLLQDWGDSVIETIFAAYAQKRK